MIVARMKRHLVAASLVVASTLFAGRAMAQQPFQLHSTTFNNDSVLPLSTVLNYPSNGVNTCTANGAAGGDQSPELFWTGAPWGTKSFVVVLYDTTAAFTHWGMYNIPAYINQLPQNAGVANSKFGQQVGNDFGFGPQYDGPCPPAGVAPTTHQYVFTVYALSETLNLPSSANFPANAETLYHALIRAGDHGAILGKASLVGLYSATPASN